MDQRVDRQIGRGPPPPPDPLVHTSGQSYPSAHAANSVGWLALAIALIVAIPTRGRQIAASLPARCSLCSSA
jgi:membrane-associated phospholipid phosphatase